MKKRSALSTPFKPRSQREADIARTLRRRYRFIKHLGSGAYSSVYAVLNRSLDRVEALKVLSDELTRQEDFLDRFKVEAKISASLAHPNIVTLYEYQKLNHFYFFTMYYVDGPLLTDFIDSANPMPIRTVCTNMAAVCNAVDYAHQRGIIHRDLKASNILLDKSGKPFITDFGIAKWEKHLNQTQTGMILGSPHYVSPEQAEGREIDTRSDIYSLGVTLYVLLTQNYPFAGDTPHVTIAKRLSQPPTPPDTFKPDLPQRLIEILDKSLQKNRQNRYSSASDLASDLTGFVASENCEQDGAAASTSPRQASMQSSSAKFRPVLVAAILALMIAVPIFIHLIGKDPDMDDERHPPKSKIEDLVVVHREKISGQDHQRPEEDLAAAIEEGSAAVVKEDPAATIKEDPAVATDVKIKQPELPSQRSGQMPAAGLAIKRKIPKFTKSKTVDGNGFGQRQMRRELDTLSDAVKREYERGNDDACLTIIDIASKKIKSLPAPEQERYSDLSLKIDHYRVKATRRLGRNKHEKALVQLIEKMDRQFQEGDFQACRDTVKSAISKIEGFDKDQQDSFVDIKRNILSYQQKAADAIHIREQQFAVIDQIKKRAAKGDLKGAISMVDAMLVQVNLSPEVKEALHQQRNHIEALMEGKP